MYQLDPFRVGNLRYRCRDTGYGVEEGQSEGCFTGEVDSWGKWTFVPWWSLPESQLYLFADEVESFEPLSRTISIHTHPMLGVNRREIER